MARALSTDCKLHLIRLFILAVVVILLILVYKIAQTVYDGNHARASEEGAVWRREDPDLINGGEELSVRGDSQTAYCSSLDILVVQGGDKVNSQGSATTYYDDLWAYSFENKNWIRLNASAHSRVFGTMTLVSSKEDECSFFLHGGYNENGLDLVSTSYIYDIVQQNDTLVVHETQVQVPEKFQNFASRATHNVNDGLVYFVGGSKTSPLTSPYVSKNTIRFETFDNELEMFTYSVTTGNFTDVNLAQSNIPHFRVFHTTAYVPEENKLIMYGGHTKDLNGLWVFSFDEQTWTQFGTIGGPFSEIENKLYADMAYYKGYLFINAGVTARAIGRNTNVITYELRRSQNLMATKIDFKAKKMGCPSEGEPLNFCTVESDTTYVANRHYSAFVRNINTYSIFGGVMWLYDYTNNINELNLDDAIDNLKYPEELESQIFQFVLIVSVVTFLISTVLLILQRPRMVARAEAEEGSLLRGGASESAIKSLPLVKYTKDIQNESTFATGNLDQEPADNSDRSVNILVREDVATETQQSSGDTELAISDGAYDVGKRAELDTRGNAGETENVSLGDHKEIGDDNDIRTDHSGNEKQETPNNFYEDDDVDMCAICICDFELGEEVRVLPCKHFFHPGCVDVWLRKNKACPMCKKDVLSSNNTEATTSEVVSSRRSQRTRRRPNINFTVRPIVNVLVTRLRRNRVGSNEPNQRRESSAAVTLDTSVTR